MKKVFLESSFSTNPPINHSLVKWISKAQNRVDMRVTSGGIPFSIAFKFSDNTTCYWDYESQAARDADYVLIINQ